MDDLYFVTLKNRGLIQIDGKDRHDFVQNLVTNDVSKIAPGKAVYACLLTAQGKFLHDFFISEIEGAIFLECEGGERAQDLYKRLNMYRLRADVQISVEDNVPVYAVFGQERGYADPRHADIGWRTFEKPDLEEQPFETWDEHRIGLTIPDGSRDLIPNSSTMDEGRMDRLNAIDYDKGCYVGQELTARMHYRGLGKKHLYAVKGDLPEPGTAIEIDGKTIGEMRSKCGDTGLALIKDEFAESLSGTITRLAEARTAPL